MACCVRSSRQGSSLQRRSTEPQYMAGSAKYDVSGSDVITWKQHQQQQQHHVYNRSQSSQYPHQHVQQQYPTAFVTDRDYATTLQMRRTAAAQTSLLRPDHVESAAVAASCSCPLHGHLALPVEDDFPPPPPPSPRPTAARFSSFRPRIEHIYEVPKFVDGGSGVDLDDEATGLQTSSPLYSELDTRSFGTVGRRTPSTKSSRRQPHSSLQS